MNWKGWGFVGGVFAATVVTALWIADGQSTAGGMSMEERLEQLKTTHERRIERIDEIADEQLSRALREQIFNHYYAALENAVFDSAPYEIEYSTPRLERLNDYASMTEMAKVYLDNFVAKPTSPNAQCFQVKPPFNLPVAHQLRMQTLTLADGATLQMPDIMSGRRQTPELRDRGDSVCFQATRAADAELPAGVTAELSTHLPDELVEFEFGPDDVGVTQRRAGYAVTLVEMNNYSYAIEVDVGSAGEGSLRDEDVLGEALAENGRFIQPRVTDKVRTEDFRELDELMDDLILRAERRELSVNQITEEIVALRDQIEAARGSTLYKAFAFHGAVEKAQVTLLHHDGGATELTHILDIPFYSEFPAEEGEVVAENLPNIAVPGPVYNYDPALRAEFVDLTAEDMAENIEIRQRSISPQHDPGVAYPAQLFFHYPDVQSDRFIQIFDRYGLLEPSDVEFFDADGQPITLPDGGNDVLRFTVSRLEFNPQGFPQLPARVKVTIPVLTAPDMVKQRFSRNELPAGVSLDGNRLSIDYSVFTPDEMEDTSARRIERRNQVFGKDAEGRYLAEVATMTQPRQEGDPVDLYYFYGEPEVFEIWYRGEMKTVGFEIDIKLEDKLRAAGLIDK